MPFFSRFHTPTSEFPSGVFRLLDELNQSSPSSIRRNSVADGGNRLAFSPNFDVHETESAFILEGELPGLGDKSKVNIEFTDGNTLLVRGRIEKSSVKASPSAEPTTTNENAAAATLTEESQAARRTDRFVGSPTDSVRYWVSERTVGEFQRSFSFPGAVDIDTVKANLENGLLKIIVPKKGLAKGRKIEVF